MKKTDILFKQYRDFGNFLSVVSSFKEIIDFPNVMGVKLEPVVHAADLCVFTGSLHSIKINITMQFILRIVKNLRKLDNSSSNCLAIIVNCDMHLEDDFVVRQKLHERIVQFDFVIGAGVEHGHGSGQHRGVGLVRVVEQPADEESRLRDPNEEENVLTERHLLDVDLEQRLAAGGVDGGGGAVHLPELHVAAVERLLQTPQRGLPQLHLQLLNFSCPDLHKFLILYQLILEILFSCA